MDPVTFLVSNWPVTVSVVVLIVLYFLYNRLIKSRNMAQAALSSIEIQLRKRYDLIPNVLSIAKKYMEHEKSTFDQITKLRTEALSNSDAEDPSAVAKLFSDDAKLSGMMGKLMVSMEAYPELRAVESMKEAMATYQDVEDNISAARRFYNSAVNELKNAVDIFPSSMIASAININAMPFYEDPESDTIQSTVNAAEFFDKS
jgi:LemA protein